MVLYTTLTSLTYNDRVVLAKELSNTTLRGLTSYTLCVLSYMVINTT